MSRAAATVAVRRWSGGLAALFVLLAASSLVGCSSTQGRFVPEGAVQAPRASDAPVEIHRDRLPTRPYTRVGRLDVHLEQTAFRKPTFEQALPELERRARAAGAEAIIEIREQRSQLNETMIYHITATGIRFTDAVMSTTEVPLT